MGLRYSEAFIEQALFKVYSHCKRAVKMHTLLDLRGAIPAFIRFSDGKISDVKVLDILPIEAGRFT